jgi:hypothetical protein
MVDIFIISFYCNERLHFYASKQMSLQHQGGIKKIGDGV